MGLNKNIIVAILMLLLPFAATAQQHNLKQPTNCRYARGPVPANYVACPACSKDKEQDDKARKDERDKREAAKPKYGALAVDRNNGFYYGWAYDYPTLEEAEKRAEKECTDRGGSCSVVLAFLGSGCAAYRTITGNVGTAYGWGVAKTKEEADRIAREECLKYSSGTDPKNFVWACNSTTTAPLQELYNNREDISGPMGYINSVAFSPDGRKLYVGGEKGFLYVIDVASQKIVKKVANVSSGTSAVSADGKMLAISSGYHISIFDAVTFKLIRKLEILPSGNNKFGGISFTPDGRNLAAAGENRYGSSYIFNVSTGDVRKLEVSTDDLANRHTAISPDGSTVAITYYNGHVRFWDISSGSLKDDVNVDGAVEGWESMGDYSPNGKYYVSIGWDNDGRVKFWDASTNSIIRTFGDRDKNGEGIKFYGNDKAVSVNMQNDIKLWDLNSGSVIWSATDATYPHIDVSSQGVVATGGVWGLQIYVPDGSGGLKLAKMFKSH